MTRKLGVLGALLLAMALSMGAQTVSPSPIDTIEIGWAGSESQSSGYVALFGPVEINFGGTFPLGP